MVPAVIVVAASLIAWQALKGPTTLDVTVGPGTTPDISWSPAKGLTTVIVYQGAYESKPPLDPARIMWRIESLDGAQLLPPVHYGEEIPDAVTVHKAKALVVGQTYTVHLFRDDDGYSGDSKLYETLKTFTVTQLSE